jgi:hypothetical protein
MALDFALKSPRIREEILLEFNDTYGTFYIANGGSTPELREGFYYADKRNQFYFYAMQFKRDQQWFINIHEIVSAAKIGPISVAAEDAPYLEQNIRHVFTTRRFLDLKTRLTANIYEVTFSWRIGE